MISIPQQKHIGYQIGLENKSIFLLHPRSTDNHLKGSQMKKVFQVNEIKKQAIVDSLISDKKINNFKPKLIQRNRERHYIFINEKNH